MTGRETLIIWTDRSDSKSEWVKMNVSIDKYPNLCKLTDHSSSFTPVKLITLMWNSSIITI